MSHSHRWIPTRLRLLTALALVLALAGCERPEVELAQGDGADWAQWQGQWLLVNYWAEWCAPCRKEIPELNRLHAEADDVTVLGVNFDGLQGDALAALATEMGIEFPVLVVDPRARWDQPLPTVLPTTLVIDPAGELREVLVGPQTYESLARVVGLSADM